MTQAIDLRRAHAEPAAPAAADSDQVLLRHGHPEWVRDLSAATRVTAGGVALLVTGAVLVATVPGALGAWLGPVVGIAGAALCARAAWSLTAADPAGRVETSSSTARRAIRAGVLLGAVGCALQLFVLVTPVNWNWRDTFYSASLITCVLGAVGTLTLLRHTAALALRIPNPALAHRARFAGWGVGFAQAALTSFAAIGPSAGTSFGLARHVIAYATVVTLVALVVYGVLCLHLLHRLGRALSIQADFSQGLASRPRRA